MGYRSSESFVSSLRWPRTTSTSSVFVGVIVALFAFLALPISRKHVFHHLPLPFFKVTPLASETRGLSSQIGPIGEAEPIGLADSPIDRHWVAVIDAGSTGTRIHVFAYRHDTAVCKQQPEAHFLVELPERALKVTPGLADVYRMDAYHKQPEIDASVQNSSKTETYTSSKREWPQMERYFERLRQFMVDVVPAEELGHSPVLFRGTAGMREMRQAEQDEALEVIRGILNGWGVAFQKTSILEGTCEGVYSWLMLNQLAGNFGTDQTLFTLTDDDGGEKDGKEREGKSRQGRKNMMTMVEMGGMSAQVVLELPSEKRKSNNEATRRVVLQPSEKNKEENDKNGTRHNERDILIDPSDGRYASFDLYGEQHDLIAQSFSGMGRQLAMQRYIIAMLREASRQIAQPSTAATSLEVELACLPPDASFSVPTTKNDRPILDLLVTPSFVVEGFTFTGDKTDKEREDISVFVVGTGNYEKCVEEVGRHVVLPRKDNGIDSPPIKATKSSSSSHLTSQTANGGDGNDQEYTNGNEVDDNNDQGEEVEGKDEVLNGNIAREDEDSQTADRGRRRRGTYHYLSDEWQIEENVVVSQKLPIEAFLAGRREEGKDMGGVTMAATESFYYFHRYVTNSHGKYFSPGDFYRRAKMLCSLSIDEVRQAIDPEAAAEKSVSACFGLIFMALFLERVVGIERDGLLWAVNEVSNIGITWPAGLIMSQLPDLTDSNTSAV